MSDFDYAAKIKSMLTTASDQEKVKGYMAFIKGYARASMDDPSKLIPILEETIDKICEK